MCNLKRTEQLQTIFTLHKDNSAFFDTNKHSSVIVLKNSAHPLADSATKTSILFIIGLTAVQEKEVKYFFFPWRVRHQNR